MTNTNQFQKATKSQAKVRLALFGPSGGGKTYSALRIAMGLAGGGTTALIDTERGSASKYADKFSFDTLDLNQHSVTDYIAAIKAAEAGKYAVLIIDSLTHGWRDLVEEVDKLARSKYGGNSWAAWSEGTPKQRALISALLAFPGHIIATMRTKTEWTVQTGSDGRKTPVRIGLAPEEGKGIEYEFDILIQLSPDHLGQVLKDRSSLFQDQIIDKPDETFGQQLAAWLDQGVEPEPRPAPAAPKATGSLLKAWKDIGLMKDKGTQSNVDELLKMSPWPNGLDEGDPSVVEQAVAWGLIYMESRKTNNPNDAAADANLKWLGGGRSEE